MHLMKFEGHCSTKYFIKFFVKKNAVSPPKYPQKARTHQVTLSLLPAVYMATATSCGCYSNRLVGRGHALFVKGDQILYFSSLATE
jgi:hypothetical protein